MSKINPAILGMVVLAVVAVVIYYLISSGKSAAASGPAATASNGATSPQGSTLPANELLNSSSSASLAGAIQQLENEQKQLVAFASDMWIFQNPSLDSSSSSVRSASFAQALAQVKSVITAINAQMTLVTSKGGDPNTYLTPLTLQMLTNTTAADCESCWTLVQNGGNT